MTHDLQTALDELAARVEASHRSSTRLPVEQIVTRVRHRRRTRAALVSGGAAAGIVLLAGAAFAVLPDRTPEPPAHPVSPTTTPTPTTAQVVMPTGDPGLPFGVCGSLVSSPTSLPLTDAAQTSVVVPVPAIGAGEPLGVQAEVGLSFVRDVSLISPATGPRLVVSRDGVVVAVGNVYDGEDVGLDHQDFGGESAPVTYAGWLELSVCDPGDGGTSSGRALPGGSYEVRPWAEVSTIDVATPDLGSTQTLEDLDASADAHHAAVVGDPVAFEVVGSAQTPSPRPSSDAPLAALSSANPEVACGAPMPADLGGSPQLRLTATPASSTVAVGEPVQLAGTLVYSGPGHALAGVRDSLDLIVVRDGIAVAADPYTDYFSPPVDLSHAAGLVVDGAASLGQGCDGRPLPPGTYQVYPRIAVTGVELRSAGGELRGTSGEHGTQPAVIGTPFVLTLS